MSFGGPGNLASGGALLKSGFGEPIATGSIVGFQLDLTDPKQVNITIFQDGKNLGEAFSSKRPEGATMYPAVSGNKKGDKFRIRVGGEPSPPKANARQTQPHEG